MIPAAPLLFAMFIAFFAAQDSRQVDPEIAPSEELSVLIFSKTAGFRHQSIPDGIKAIRALCEENGIKADDTEDAARFSDESLAEYDVVIFLNTTGDVLDDEQQEAFEKYIQNGGGFVGIHSATDTEYDWPWYGELVGAYFAGHPAIQEATVRVLDRDHPSTKHLAAEWVRTDEWYNFRTAPDPEKYHILAEVDESTYTGGTMSGNHPIAWCREYDGGRAWYTAGGHTSESYTEEAFLQHLLGGIRWAAGEGAEE